jgi:DNA-directed RNA polymerase subunit RPC12/RpoP
MSETARKQKARGIACVKCGCRHFFTTHTEPLRDGRIRRRKVCRHCGRKIVTHEAPLGPTTPGHCYM